MEFKNKLIVIYPFIPLVILGEDKFAGIKFRNLDVRFYVPRYTNLKKPQKDIKNFFDCLLPQLVLNDGRFPVGLGYSIFTFKTDEDKEKILAKIRGDIELFYYLSHKNNGPVRGLNFPKFYYIDNISNYSNKDYKYSFEFHEELETQEHHMIYTDDKINNHKILIKFKEDTFIQDLFLTDDWKKFIKKRNSYRFKNAIFWINRSRDEEKTQLEKIIFGVMALENVLDFNKKDSEKFADSIIKRLGASLNGITKEKTDRFRVALIQAYKVRSGIVHGGIIKEGLHIENRTPSRDTLLNFGGSRYYQLSYVLTAVFDILLESSIFGNGFVSTFRSKKLIDSIYPNRECLSLARASISGLEPSIESFQILGRKLLGIKEYEHIDINTGDLGAINSFINKLVEKTEESLALPDFRIDSLARLIRDPKSLNYLRKIAEELDKWKDRYMFADTFVPLKNREVLIGDATEGLVGYLNFLAHYILIRQRDSR